MVQITHKLSLFMCIIALVEGAGGSLVGRATMLQAGRSSVRFLMRSFDFSIDIVLQPSYGPGIDPASNRNKYQDSC
jgi:hypothetical protein